jgi:hypothetical protein
MQSMKLLGGGDEGENYKNHEDHDDAKSVLVTHLMRQQPDIAQHIAGALQRSTDRASFVQIFGNTLGPKEERITKEEGANPQNLVSALHVRLRWDDFSASELRTSYGRVGVHRGFIMDVPPEMMEKALLEMDAEQKMALWDFPPPYTPEEPQPWKESARSDEELQEAEGAHILYKQLYVIRAALLRHMVTIDNGLMTDIGKTYEFNNNPGASLYLALELMDGSANKPLGKLKDLVSPEFLRCKLAGELEWSGEVISGDSLPPNTAMSRTYRARLNNTLLRKSIKVLRPDERRLLSDTLRNNTIEMWDNTFENSEDDGFTSLCTQQVAIAVREECRRMMKQVA